MTRFHAASWAMAVLALGGAAVAAYDPVGMKTLREPVISSEI